MADRRDYYFRQTVTEAELDAGFNGLEVADRNLSVDHYLIGITEGMVASEKSGVPDLTVDVSGPGSAYSKQGERIAFSALQNVDLSQDDGAVSTAVSTPGNARIVSLFIQFDRILSDPRIDGLGVTVYHQRAESFAFSVVAGVEAVSGSEVAPALDTNKILLADVTLTYGQTQILNSNIAVTRREDAYRLTGGTVEVIAGSAHAALSSLLGSFNNHLTGTANKHPAADVTYAGSPNWAGAVDSITATDVEAAIDEVVTDLASITNPSGGERIGTRALVATWNDGNGYTASNVWGLINQIVTDLGSSAINGGDKIGIAASVATFADSVGLVAGSVWDQLGSILTQLGSTAGAGKVGNTPAGNIAATTVQAALNELDGEKAGLATNNAYTGSNSFDRTGDDNASINVGVAPAGTLKLVFEALLQNGVYERIYTLGDAGLIFTKNAKWQSGTSNWTSDSATYSSMGFSIEDTSSAQTKIVTRPAGAGTWTTWSTELDLTGDGNLINATVGSFLKLKPSGDTEALLYSPTTPIGSYNLLFQFATGTQPIRFYLSSSGSLWITSNAYWNSTAWQKDSAGATSLGIEASPAGLLYVRRRNAVGGTWTTWDYNASLSYTGETSGGEASFVVGAYMVGYAAASSYIGANIQFPMFMTAQPSSYTWGTPVATLNVASGPVASGPTYDSQYGTAGYFTTTSAGNGYWYGTITVNP